MLIDNIDEKTLLQLIRQSFSVNNLSVHEAKELASAMLMNKKQESVISSITCNQPFKVYLTHDIDWIYPFHIYSIIKAIASPNKWLSFKQVLQSDIYLKNIEKLIAFEKSQNINSIFLVGSNNSAFSLQRYAIRYTNGNIYFKKLIGLLKDNQNEIGLHSEQYIDMRQQISCLERILYDRKLKYHRSHFMKFNPLKIWNELSENKIMIDFSIGSAREVGFLNGIPRHYQAIDFLNKKVLATAIVPTILSDNAFFFKDSKSVFASFRETIKKAEEFGAAVAILFHPENMIIKPELWEYYEQIIHICKNENAIFNPSPDTL